MKWWEKVFIFILGLIGKCIVLITSPVFKYIYEEKRHAIPNVQSQLLMKSATQLAHMIRNKEKKSEEIVQAYIKRIQQVNPMVNGLVSDRFEKALEEAKHVDDILGKDDIPDEYSISNKPFLGVPFTAKEAFAITGQPNTSGLLGRKNIIAEEDADAVALFRQAGAIPLGVTNCSELCMWYESSNLLYGRTKNPYHQGRIVGGSSGGEGCVQAYAGSAFGIGSDIGGSIRMPSFFCGIFGHKPTTGVVSNTGQFPNATSEAQTFLSTGPMCRYATDLLPLFKVLVLPEYRETLKLDEKVNLSKVKVYYMLEDGSDIGSSVNPQIKEAISKAVSYIEGTTGVVTTKASISKLKHSVRIWATKMSTSGNDKFCHLMGNYVSLVNPYLELLLWLLQFPRHTIAAIGLGIVEKIQTPEQIQRQHREMCDALREEFHELLGEDGVLIYPTHAVPAPYHNQPLTMIPNFGYTAIFNVLGLPATAVPMGISKEGVPIGIQIIGWQNSDRLTIAVAEELERAFGGWVPPFQV